MPIESTLFFDFEIANSIPMLNTCDFVDYQNVFIEKFRKWVGELFDKHYQELKKMYSPKKIFSGKVIEKEQGLFKKRQIECEKKIQKLKLEYPMRLSPELLEKCAKECREIYIQHDKLLNQNIEIFLNKSPMSKKREVETKREQPSQTYPIFDKNNCHRELIIKADNQLKQKIPDKNTIQQSHDKSTLKLIISENMLDEEISAELKNFLEKIQTQIDVMYEQTCIILYNLYFRYYSPTERKEKRKLEEKFVLNLIEEMKHLLKNAYVLLHPDKVGYKFQDRIEVVRYYQAAFSAIQDNQSDIKNLVQYLSDPHTFCQDEKAKAILKKHDLLIHPNLIQDLKYLEKSNRDDDFKTKITQLREDMEKDWQEFHVWIDEIWEGFEKSNEIQKAGELNQTKFMKEMEQKQIEKKQETQQQLAKLREENKAEILEQVTTSNELLKKLGSMERRIDDLINAYQAQIDQGALLVRDEKSPSKETFTAIRLSNARNSIYAESAARTAEEVSAASNSEMVVENSFDCS